MREGRVTAYTSSQLKDHERNYPTHNLELVIVVFALTIWLDCLDGESCEVYINHKSLKHFFTQKNLNMKQGGWMELISDYWCEIKYHPGKVNWVANALSTVSGEFLAGEVIASLQESRVVDFEELKTHRMRDPKLLDILPRVRKSRGAMQDNSRVIPAESKVKEKTPYSVHLGSTKKYRDLKKRF
ncbi:uncharacterized protein LOC121255219 [Juglans microcarpa x Juglans regia]|uniref:uncharacterized protein LOC121255219 n=1 Tax=Juglans microcarpa x Juglans regia TaxID=2249226 RepID=UPI001B7E1FD2|nr:uncharacterized protein LOC121255219 [Juglans microcarpa x Juglans regia]